MNRTPRVSASRRIAALLALLAAAVAALRLVARPRPAAASDEFAPLAQPFKVYRA